MMTCDKCGGVFLTDYVCEECAALPPVRSEPMLAAAFADFWHAKWPHQTRDVKKLEMSVCYVVCREAFYAGAQAANPTGERQEAHNAQ